MFADKTVTSIINIELISSYQYKTNHNLMQTEKEALTKWNFLMHVACTLLKIKRFFNI